MEMKDKIITKTIEGMGHARALLYTLESLPLPVMNRIITGQERKLPTKDQQQLIIEKVKTLIAKDSADFVTYGMPLQTLVPEKPSEHFQRWVNIMGDSAVSFWRRRNNKTAEFSRKVKNLHNFPKYYQRNYHHQTDGYLSDQSANLYEHQVELLFRGLAAPMRRRVLPSMIKKLSSKKNPKILEIACGTGTFTRELLACFPKARITAVDLSPNYINQARRRFLKNSSVDFMVADATNLPFKDQHFDAVVSVYLHHELPMKIRKESIEESLRVAKSSGFWGLVDSLQLGDDEQLDWAISEFPKTFHEPFFTNYIKNPLKPWLDQEFKERKFNEECHLLTKVIYSNRSGK